MIELGDIVMRHDLKRQGLSVSAIARRLGLDRKTVRKHLEAGIGESVYGPLASRTRQLEPFEPDLRERNSAFPDLSIRRTRKIAFQRRFKSAPGRPAQVDFTQFRVECGDEPGAARIVRTVSFLGRSYLVQSSD